MMVVVFLLKYVINALVHVSVLLVTLETVAPLVHEGTTAFHDVEVCLR